MDPAPTTRPAWSKRRNVIASEHPTRGRDAPEHAPVGAGVADAGGCQVVLGDDRLHQRLDVGQRPADLGEHLAVAVDAQDVVGQPVHHGTRGVDREVPAEVSAVEGVDRVERAGSC